MDLEISLGIERHNAHVAKLADALPGGGRAVRCAGSSPAVRTTLKALGDPGFTGVSEGKSGSGKADCQKIVRGFQPHTTTSQNSLTLSGLPAHNPLTET